MVLLDPGFDLIVNWDWEWSLAGHWPALWGGVELGWRASGHRGQWCVGRGSWPKVLWCPVVQRWRDRDCDFESEGVDAFDGGPRGSLGRSTNFWEIFTDHGEGRCSVFVGVRRADCQGDATLDVPLRALDSTSCSDLYFDEGPWVNPEGVESAQCEDANVHTGVCESLGEGLGGSCCLVELRLAAKVSHWPQDVEVGVGLRAVGFRVLCGSLAAWEVHLFLLLGKVRYLTLLLMVLLCF